MCIRDSVGGGTSNFSFAKQNYFYPFGGLPGYGGGSIPTGLDLLIPLSPMSEFSNPDNFAFSSDDWVWRTVKFKGAEEGDVYKRQKELLAGDKIRLATVWKE